MRSLLLLATALVAGCAQQPLATTAPVQPQFTGSVASISTADRHTIVALERAAILREFHAEPSSVTIDVLSRNHVMVVFDIRGEQYGDPVDRIKGAWKRPNVPRAIVVGLTRRCS